MSSFPTDADLARGDERHAQRTSVFDSLRRLIDPTGQQPCPVAPWCTGDSSDHEGDDPERWFHYTRCDVVIPSLAHPNEYPATAVGGFSQEGDALYYVFTSDMEYIAATADQAHMLADSFARQAERLRRVAGILALDAGARESALVEYSRAAAPDR